MRDFIQGPDSRVVCNPRAKIEQRQLGGGTVVNGRENRLQKDSEGRPGYEGRQPEAKVPVDRKYRLGTGHTTTHPVVSERQDDRRAVRTLVEQTTRAAETLRAVSEG
jgi:hypothetical protein